MNKPCTKCSGTGLNNPHFSVECRWCGGTGDEVDRIRRTILEEVPEERDYWRAKAKARLAEWMAQNMDELVAKQLFSKDKE